MRASLALLPLVLGCGYSTHYPVWGPGLVDTGANPAGEPPVPCGEDGSVGQLQVINTLNETITLAEVAPSTCEQVHITYLDPGASFESSVVTGHTWVARGLDGAMIEVFTVPSGAGTWVEYVP